MKCYQRLKQLREDQDISQANLAKIIHVAQTTYSDYEHGRIRVPLEILIDLAEYYDVDLNYISGITDKREPFPRQEKSAEIDEE